MEFQIKPLDESCVGSLRILAQACPPLGLHSAFTYWVVAHFFQNIRLSPNKENSPVGYVMCISTRDEPDLLYVWQVGVLPDYRKHRLAEKLLNAVYKKGFNTGIRRIQVTIDDANTPSNALFKSFAQKHGLQKQIVGQASFIDPIENVEEVENIIEISALDMHSKTE